MRKILPIVILLITICFLFSCAKKQSGNALSTNIGDPAANYLKFNPQADYSVTAIGGKAFIFTYNDKGNVYQFYADNNDQNQVLNKLWDKYNNGGFPNKPRELKKTEFVKVLTEPNIKIQKIMPAQEWDKYLNEIFAY